jgi:CAAX protease family protein
MRSLLKFFFITYLASWLLFCAAAYFNVRPESRAPRIYSLADLLYLPGAIMPSLVAIALTLLEQGRVGVAELLRGIGRWRVGLRWYLFALTFFAVIKLAAAGLQRMMTATWPAFGQLPWYMILVAIVVSTPVQAGEEVGWRGYALPRLAKRVGFPTAGIVVGVIWGCWHLPFFFIPGSDNYGQSFPMYLLAVTALSVVLTFLYWRTNGSLLLPMLMHAAINNSAGIASSASITNNPFALRNSILAWSTTGLLWISAGYFIFRMRVDESKLSPDLG